MSFRSAYADELLMQILRLSESERVITGTPPAAPEEIKNLPEIKINEAQCKKCDLTGKLEFPRCAICLEDLEFLGTLMPCGHLYDKDCISNWLA